MTPASVSLLEKLLIKAFEAQDFPVSEIELKVWMPPEWPENIEIDIEKMARDIERYLS